MARTMQMLNTQGHVTVHWEEQNDAIVLPVIELMLASKYRFFILHEEAGVVSEVPITTTADIPNRRILIGDDHLQQLYDSGLLKIGGITVEADNTGELAETPEAVAAHDTVVTKPAKGG